MIILKQEPFTATASECCQRYGICWLCLAVIAMTAMAAYQHVEVFFVWVHRVGCF